MSKFISDYFCAWVVGIVILGVMAVFDSFLGWVVSRLSPAFGADLSIALVSQFLMLFALVAAGIKAIIRKIRSGENEPPE